ncbi:MAG: hypothetical protein Q9174_007337, partial [Haloplaca sp. 1 TL-2023]
MFVNYFGSKERSVDDWRFLLRKILPEFKIVGTRATPSPINGVIDIVWNTTEPIYHTTDAKYTLPNDIVKHARLEDQAVALAEMMGNRSTRAPIHSPSKILDIGCGTGIVTRQLGKAHPSAQVYGIDLSPVPVPAGAHAPNVEYIVGDVRKMITRLGSESTDFIYSRLLIMGMTDWPGYVRDMYSLLRPGGWVEMQEFSLDWYMHGSYCSQDWDWLRALFLAAEKKGYDLRAGRNVEAYMRQAGFVDIEMIEYRVPIGPWLEGPETKRIGEHAEREYGELYYHAIPKMLEGMGLAKEKVEELQK